MPQSTRITYLSYSKIPSIPILGPLFYILQSYLYEKRATNSIFISRRKTGLQKKLLAKISKSSSLTVCKSPKFGRQLETFDSELVLDISIDRIGGLTQPELYDLMWSLVFAKSVTQKTKKTLDNFIPEDFPVSKTVVVPYNDSFDVLADYVFQTVKILGKKGHIVYLIAAGYPRWIVTYLLKRIFSERINTKVLGYKNLVMVYPLKLFPHALRKFPLVKRLNRYFSNLSSSIFVKRLKPDLLWSFDRQDLELVRLTKNQTLSLYDCVDYFSTLDPATNEQIRKGEKKLIKSVNYFVVNSNALKKVKQHIRKPDKVVPQGFDIESFETKEVLTSKEKKEISSVKKLFKSIPHPRVGFVGNLTYRLDFKLLRSLIRKMPRISFVFTDAFLPMPKDDKYKDTEKLIEEIKSFKNVYLVPRTQNRKVIKEIIRNFNIGIIPYDVLFDFNHYCYPMKLFEYFYIGIPVVSTPIEELKRFPKFVKIANTGYGWEKHIKALLGKPWPKEHIREQRKLAHENSWRKKIEAIVKVVKSH